MERERKVNSTRSQNLKNTSTEAADLKGTNGHHRNRQPPTNNSRYPQQTNTAYTRGNTTTKITFYIYGDNSYLLVATGGVSNNKNKEKEMNGK